MKKPKKITVKFFLNRNLQPIETEGSERHPLYTQITYDRKNTQIKCAYGWFYTNMDQVEEEDPHLLMFEENILKRSVQFELDKLGDNFRLKGLGRKYEKYCVSIHALFNTYLKARFKELLKNAQPEKFLEVLNIEKPNLDFFVIYDASQRLFDNMKDIIDPEFYEEMSIYQVYFDVYREALSDKKYEFPVVIDWLDGGHPKELETKLMLAYEGQSAKVEASIALINKIITTKLELF